MDSDELHKMLRGWIISILDNFEGISLSVDENYKFIIDKTEENKIAFVLAVSLWGKTQFMMVEVSMDNVSEHSVKTAVNLACQEMALQKFISKARLN